MNEVLNTILDVLTWVVSIPTLLPPEAWAVLGSAIGVSVVMQTIKSKLEMTNPKTIVLVTTILSLVVTAFAMFISNAEANPQLLGEYTTATLGIATIVYRYLVQPSYAFLLDVREFQESKKVPTDVATDEPLNSTQAIETAPATITSPGQFQG